MEPPPSATSTSRSSTGSHPPPTPPFPSPGLQQSGQRGEYDQAAQAAAATATAALSQQHTPTPNNASGVGKKRKPNNAPGSRGVANLTPEQLAKKRANDREAQRAIRERTRNTIESLEQRIRELESQQPFQDLQRVIQERDRALAECEELRKRLSAVAGIVGAQHPGLNGLAALTAQQTPMSQRPSQHQQPQQPYSGPTSSGRICESQHIHPDLRSPTSSAHNTPPGQGRTATPGSSAHQSNEAVALRRWSPSMDHLTNAQPMPVYTATNGVQYGQQAAQTHTAANGGERLGVNFLLDSNQQHQQRTTSSPGTVPIRSPRPDQPVYECLTYVGPSSCPLDSLLIDFHRSRRELIQEGASEYDAIGPEYPAFSSMIDPSFQPRPHPVSALLIDILSKFPDIGTLPEKVAVLYIMFLILRWEICPTAENYNRLPPWCRPVQEQLERPHVQWCDYLPFPHMRRQLSLAEKDVKFEDFFVPYTTTLSLNWHLPNDCILLPPPKHQDDNRGLTLNPAFEAHLRILENWSLGSAFRNTFPHLVDATVRIHDP